MKIRNPVYLALALFLNGLLATANHNGWDSVNALASRARHHMSPSTQHK
jgi:hypothetical protein